MPSGWIAYCVRPVEVAVRRSRRPVPEIHGWIAVDKPAGMTSTMVSNRVRRLTGVAKCGHGGTLDPLATGVLPIALGNATKTVAYAMDAEKSYLFGLRWGEERDTDDADGQVTATSDVRPDRAAIVSALPAFVGLIEQVPPAYSAVKVAGERAYKLARESRPVELNSRIVSIRKFALVDMSDGDTALFEVVSGKGAYMRSLARDLARRLGTVGHVCELRRTRVGAFAEARAVPLETLEGLGHIGPDSPYLLPVETALADIPALALTGSEAASLRRGQAVALFGATDLDRIGHLADGATVRAESGGRIVALARFEGGRVHPMRVMNP